MCTCCLFCIFNVETSKAFDFQSPASRNTIRVRQLRLWFEFGVGQFFSKCRRKYPALGHLVFFKWQENKYFSPYAYCFIFKSDLLNPDFVKKKSYFILFFLQSYFFDEQSTFLAIRFCWNEKVKHWFIYGRKLK